MNRTLLAISIASALAQPCWAADPEPASRSEVEALRREINELKAQMEALRQERAGGPTPAAQPPVAQTPPTQPPAAQAPTAQGSPSSAAAPASDTRKPTTAEAPRGGDSSASYPSPEKPESPVRIFGYGELNYNHFTEESTQTTADLARFVIGFGYAFTDQLHFNSEVEWEHAVTSADDVGEVEIEQAVLDYQVSRQLNVKGGLFLMPFGLLNLNHEPPVFYGVDRNEVELRIIPTTWREGGIGVSWATDNGITYEAGVTTGFNLNSFDDPGAPLRSMHQELALARAADLSAYAGVKYRGMPGLTLGAEVFTGNSTQDNAAFKADNTQPDFGNLTGRVTLWDVHARWSSGRLDLQALYARGYIGQAEQIDQTLLAYNQSTGNARAFVPAGFYGWYAQAAYRVWDWKSMSLTPFVRYAYYNTQSSMPSGFDSDPVNASHVTTVGLNFYLHPQVVIKTDYQRFTNAANSRFDIGLGYMF